MPIWGAVTLAPAVVRLVGYAAAALAVLVLVWWAAVVPRLELRDEQAAHAATRTACAEMRAQWAAELAAAQARARQQEQQYAAAVADAHRGLDETRSEIRRRDAALVAARADARGLREQLRAYAAAAAVPVPDDPAAAGGGRAGTLADLAAEGGELLAEGAELLRQCAAAHDERVAEVTALVRAWPR